MKYKELSIDKAREICIKQPFTKQRQRDCNHCPLRRERIDNKGKKHTLFCYYELKIIMGKDKELDNEEIKYLNEMEKQ